jgi:hypothetical protein
MAKQAAMRDEDEVKLTAYERDALREVVTDWINEELVVPPYPPALVSAMTKLGIAPEPRAPERGARAALAAEAQAPAGPEVRLRPNLG